MQDGVYFDQGFNQLIDELNLKDKLGIDVKKTDFGDGISYRAEITLNEKEIDFSVRTHITKLDLDSKEKCKVIELLLYIRNKKYGFAHFKRYGRFTEESVDPSRWISNNLKNLEKYKRENYFRYLIGDYPVTVFPGSSADSVFFFPLLLKGAISMGQKDIFVYKIKHIEDDGYRIYSFMLLIGDTWFVFPRFAGPDSGGANIALSRIKYEIENAKKVAHIDEGEFHMDYKELVSELDLHSHDLMELSFSRFMNRFNEQNNVSRIYLEHLEDIKNYKKDRKYDRVLVLMRTMYDTLVKELCYQEGIRIKTSKKGGIKIGERQKIFRRFYRNGLITPLLMNWVDAFYDYASPPTHDLKFSKGLENIDIEHRCRIAMLIGSELLIDIIKRIKPNIEDQDFF
jgi:hypothetical protein